MVRSLTCSVINDIRDTSLLSLWRSVYGCEWLMIFNLIFQDSAELKGGRGSATMVMKCKFCSRENSIGNIILYSYAVYLID